MKKINFIILISLLTLSSKAQIVPVSTAANEVAQKIAKKMKDSLSLTVTQQNQITDKNLEIFSQKQQVRFQYATNDSLLQIHTQIVERTRDSLYKPILTIPQYDLYKQKKKNLIRVN